MRSGFSFLSPVVVYGLESCNNYNRQGAEPKGGFERWIHASLRTSSLKTNKTVFMIFSVG